MNAASSKSEDDCIIIKDDFNGYKVSKFCTSPRYDGYLQCVLIPNGFIKDRLEKMAMDIIDSFESAGAKSISLMCVLKGGFKFFADLFDGLERTLRARGTIMPLAIDFVRMKSYVNDKTGPETRLTGLEDPQEYKNKDILLVEDIIDTGNTMKRLLVYLKSLSPRSVRVASLLVKRTPGSTGYRPNFTGFEVPDLFVVGYALDYNDHFRDLHHICVINEAGKQRFSTPPSNTTAAKS